MSTLICPTCGCSLVRLGVSTEKAATHRYQDREYHFCCRECVEVFVTEPQKYLRETSDLVVCPSCLAEKPLRSTIKLEFAGREFHLCRCPHCLHNFHKNPEYSLSRLAGMVDYRGVFDKTTCCSG